MENNSLERDKVVDDVEEGRGEDVKSVKEFENERIIDKDRAKYICNHNY